jgi:hypothetical protein
MLGKNPMGQELVFTQSFVVVKNNPGLQREQLF